MLRLSSNSKEYNKIEDKEYLTNLYDKCYDLKESMNLQIKDFNEKEKTFNIIQKIVENILKNKDDDKYRILKFSNKTLKNYIFCNKCITDFLSFIGFTEMEIDNEKCFVLINLDETILQITLSTILLYLQDDSSIIS
jgi:hypothetical protein